METLFLSARQAFEGGRVDSAHGPVRIVAGARDGQVARADDGTRLLLRVQTAKRAEAEMSGLQAEYGGAVRIDGELLRYPSGSGDGSVSFHETPSGPILLVIRVPAEPGAEKKKDEPTGVGGGNLSRGTGETRVRTEWRLWTGVLMLAVIGLVVAVPVVRKSAEEARKTKHLGLVRAAAQGLILYAGENDDRLPPSDPLRVVKAKIDGPLVVPEEWLGASLGTERLSERVLVSDRAPWPDGKIAVAYADGHAEWRRPLPTDDPNRP